MEKISQKKKRIFFRWKTFLVNFFSYYRVWQTSCNMLSDFTRYYGYHWASYKIISLTPKRLLKTQIFERNLFFQRKSYFGQFSLVLSSRTDGREQFIRVHNVLWQLLGKLKDPFFKTYEVDGKNFSKKKEYFFDEKPFWSIFSRITEYGRPQVICYQASQAIMVIIEQVIRSFL